jgi:hypothetical protein
MTTPLLKEESPMAAATDPMNAMGHPIPSEGREAGYRACREMGLNGAEAWELTGRVASCMERDQPYEAERIALALPLDVTGYYRLAATLLASVEDR